MRLIPSASGRFSLSPNGERAGVRGATGRGARRRQPATLRLFPVCSLSGLPESSSWIILRAMEGKPRLIQLLSVSTSMCILAGGFAAESSNYGPYAQDHVLIKFKGEIFSQLAGLPRADALKWLLSNLNLPAGAELKEPIVSQLLQTKAAPATAPAALNLDRFLYVRLPPALSVENAVARLQD